jgi:hypothetical protein
MRRDTEQAVYISVLGLLLAGIAVLLTDQVWWSYSLETTVLGAVVIMLLLIISTSN